MKLFLTSSGAPEDSVDEVPFAHEVRDAKGKRDEEDQRPHREPEDGIFHHPLTSSPDRTSARRRSMRGVSGSREASAARCAASSADPCSSSYSASRAASSRAADGSRPGHALAHAGGVGGVPLGGRAHQYGVIGNLRSAEARLREPSLKFFRNAESLDSASRARLRGRPHQSGSKTRSAWLGTT